MSELVRTFIAVEVKNQEVLKKLIEARNALVATSAGLKPVEDENIHLTLRFIGEIPQVLVRELCNQISRLEYRKFDMHVKGIGAFPSPLRPRVIWAGVEEGSEDLKKLHDMIESIVARLGIPREKEEFVPHITLARVKDQRGIDKLVKLIAEMSGLDFGYTPVDEVYVKKSVLTPRGPIYSNLCSKKLS